MFLCFFICKLMFLTSMTQVLVYLQILFKFRPREAGQYVQYWQLSISPATSGRADIGSVLKFELCGKVRVFLPCDAMRCTVLVIVILSVCPSVTLVDCVHMALPTIMISSPHGSPIILVSGDITFIPKFEGGHPERGR